METQAIATKPVSEFNRHNPVCSMRFIDLRGVEALPPEPATGTEDGGTIHHGRREEACGCRFAGRRVCHDRSRHSFCERASVYTVLHLATFKAVGEPPRLLCQQPLWFHQPPPDHV
ncbi:hypothetical protein BC936DRAFT_140917 [Jimgerdemannia flammicorona]|uniref:Uncharacterized protein n=1 Tax=Jimgerdemannia flammicorona TaxID=994334 RepID=A0A433A390_9FUNG|nr:hypothetical protein BC936DRAFT_140917 [Jimgerdemannia flammicorona]